MGKSLATLERQAAKAQAQAAKAQAAKAAKDTREFQGFKRRVEARVICDLADLYGVSRKSLLASTAIQLDEGGHYSRAVDSAGVEWPRSVVVAISLDEHAPVYVNLTWTRQVGDDGVEGYKVEEIITYRPRRSEWDDRRDRTQVWKSLGDALVAARANWQTIEAAQVEQAARDERRAQADQQATDERQVLLDQIAGDPTAVLLVKLFTIIQAERDEWEEQVEGLRYHADEAWAAADSARADASCAQSALDNRVRSLETDNWQLEDKVRGLKDDLDKVRRQNRGW